MKRAGEEIAEGDNPPGIKKPSGFISRRRLSGLDHYLIGGEIA